MAKGGKAYMRDDAVVLCIMLLSLLLLYNVVRCFVLKSGGAAPLLQCRGTIAELNQDCVCMCVPRSALDWWTVQMSQRVFVELWPRPCLP
jgi:hypothetical protein